MKWSNTKPVIDYGFRDSETGTQYGDRRVVRKFLWFPKSLLDETRWLEFAYIEERFEDGFGFSYDIKTLYKWVEKNFVELKQNTKNSTKIFTEINRSF